MSETAQAQRLPFNKRVLKWARERQGRSYEQAAKSVGVSAQKIIDWESTETPALPTVRQARSLAEEYERPFLEFFSPEVPDVPNPSLVPDFRFYRDGVRDEEVHGLIARQAWAETQRLNILDLYEIVGEEPIQFPRTFYASILDDASVVAARAREAMAFPYTQQIGLTQQGREALPRVLRSKIESLGVLVLKDSALRRFRTRGLCIYFEVFPVIVFSNESPGAQAFTLIHEFAHILLKQSAIIGSPVEAGISSSIQVIEKWCNEFAAAFLMPARFLAPVFADDRIPIPSINDDDLSLLARHFGVSRHAMLVRLVQLKYVSEGYYWTVKRAEFLKEEEEYKSFARATYYGSRYRSSHGDLYTGLVLEAWATGRITNHNAAEFMDIKNLAHLDAIRDNFGE